MPPTVSSPRRSPTPSSRPRLYTRARKRPRLAVPSLELSKTNKRKHNERPPPSVRKRRRSIAPTPPPAKRMRQVAAKPKKDVDMTDPIPTRRPRKKTLKDVLRSHRINHSLGNIPIAPFISTRPPQVRPLPETTSTTLAAPENTDARTECSQTDNSPLPIYLTGDEQVEEVDISQASNIDHEPETSQENPLQAHLLEDGRCFVRIRRPDGTVDYYALDPHQ